MRARRVFFDAVNSVQPEALASLRKLSESQPNQPIAAALRAWGRGWNLIGAWCVDWARHTIKWQREGPSRKWRQFYHRAYAPRELQREAQRLGFDQRFSFELDSWVPTVRPWREYEKEARASFDCALKRYHDKTMVGVKASGLVPTRARRPRGGRSTSHRFLWLAGHQTRGWPIERIADALNLARSSVRQQLQELAEFIRLERRRPDTKLPKSDSRDTVVDIRGILKRARGPSSLSEALGPWRSARSERRWKLAMAIDSSNRTKAKDPRDQRERRQLEVNWLARLGPENYSRELRRSAQELDMSPAEPDRLVKRQRALLAKSGVL